MKNFPSKFFLWSAFLNFFGNETILAQPISLLPNNEKYLDKEFPLSPQTPSGFWEGTPSSVIETHFPKLPLHLGSYNLRKLRKELLKEKYTPLLENPSYQKSLLAFLIQNGDFEDAKEVLTELIHSEKDNVLLNLHWIAGENRKACEKITNLIRTSSNLEWKKQNIFCLYLNGEKERGKIAAELLSESHPEASELINALFDPLLKPPFDENIAKSPFLLAVWCSMGQEIPESFLKNMPLSSLVLIARSEKVPIKTRFKAAEEAFIQGAQEELILQILKDAPAENLLRSFLHELQAPKAAALLPLFKKAALEKKLGFIASVFKANLAKIEPSSDTLQLASYLIRAYLEIGEKEPAQKWGSFFMREAPDEAVSVLPLLHLAFSQFKWNESQLKAWQAYQSRVYPERAPQNSYNLRRILEGLREPSGSPLKKESPAPSWRQEKTLFNEKNLILLNSAAESKRKGETLLLVLSLIGETDLKDIPADKFKYLLTALSKAGYSHEARSLALEFLLAKGI